MNIGKGIQTLLAYSICGVIGSLILFGFIIAILWPFLKTLAILKWIFN